MSVKVNIHPMLLSSTCGQSAVEVGGRTVGESLSEVFQKYPELRANLLDSNGHILHHIDIFVNSESAYPEELNKSVKDGDELHIIMMLAGG